jgi:2',3'-cyclic-nucleotide 2'-phosphodiesterase (5'-nucleotidase family)
MRLFNAKVLIALTVLALLLGSATGEGDIGTTGKPPEETVLTLLHTNDLHGSIIYPGEPRGIAKIATLARRIRKEMPHVLLLDSGDIIHGTPAEKLLEGQPVIAAMNAAGYDAAAAGNHEFDWGQRIARNAIAAAGFPILSANVVDATSGEPWGGLQRFVVREVGGVRIAIFGLTTDRTPEIQWPRTIDGIEFRDAIEAAHALVPRLREIERADVVVALTHLGVETDRELAASVPGIDVILGGHSHTRLEEQVWVGKTLIAQTGSAAGHLGRIDLRIGRDDQAPGVIAINGQGGRWWGRNGVPAPLEREYPTQPLIALSASEEDDPAVSAAYHPFVERVQRYLDEELTCALEPLPADGAHEEIALGHLQADAVRAFTNADIGMSALYSLNPSGLSSGPVRVSDVYELFGGYTRQHLVVVRAPGARITEMLGSANDGVVRLHLSGVQARDDVLHIGDAPLDANRSYTVASAAHIIQEYLLGKEGVVVVRDDPEAAAIRDATIAYLRGHPPLENVVRPRLTGAVVP